MAKVNNPKTVALVAVVVLGSCSDPGQLATALRAPSYLDHAVALPAPGAQERASMLASHLSARGAHCDAAALQVHFPPCSPGFCTVSVPSHAVFLCMCATGSKVPMTAMQHHAAGPLVL